MAAAHNHGQRHDRIASMPAHGSFEASNSTMTPSFEQSTADPEVSLSHKMLSAISGSVLTSLLVTPLDVVRVRLQAQQRPSPSSRLPSFVELPPNLGISACCREVFWVQNQSQFCVASPAVQATLPLNGAVISDCAAEETQRRTFNSTLDGLRKIARNEGIRTLWRGLSPTLLMAVPGNVIYFAGYDWFRTSKRSPLVGRVSDAYAPLIAGSSARVLAAIVVSPIEMCRTRMQASQSADKNIMRSTLNGIREMVASQGWTSLWRGLTLTLWRDVPFSALYWWGYEYGRQQLDEARARADGQSRFSAQKKPELTSSELLADSFLAGAASGAIASLVTTPFDVGKTRQQTVMDSGMSAARRAQLPEGQSMPQFLLHIYRTEGTAGLFKGWAARGLKVAPACAIMISSYEIGKRMAAAAQEAE